jgi:Fe-S-cluster containining protein
LGSIDPGSNPGSPIIGPRPNWVQVPQSTVTSIYQQKHGRRILGESSTLSGYQNDYNSAVFFMARKGSLLLVWCSNCGKCCEKTEMELSSKDIKRLEETGRRLQEFAVVDDGVIRLRNVGGWCCFYSLSDKKCRIYGKRPLGCYLYPVVYLMNEGAVVDELCPMGQTISEQELRTKGKILGKLLKKLNNERKCK